MSHPNYKYGSGLSNVGSYQVSGKPFLSGGIAITKAASPVAVSFPTVTRWIYISSSAAVKVGMSDLGADFDNDGVNYFKVNTAGGQNLPSLELKCTELYLSSSVAATVDIVAGLTGIDVARINNISPSGTNWSGSAGIG
tara:strand:- start:1690 stop:2106 length:417 start_codon:yes stop_codon:yes gene_type:complete